MTTADDLPLKMSMAMIVMHLELLPLLFAHLPVFTIHSTSKVAAVLESSLFALKPHLRFLQPLQIYTDPNPQNPGEIISSRIIMGTGKAKVNIKDRAGVAFEDVRDREWPQIEHSSEEIVILLQK
jgi:hypothetical protein